MNLKKNAKVKVGALIASLVAFGAGWGLVRLNQPVPVAADTASSGAASAQGSNFSSRNASSASQMTTPRRRVRTHVS
jgi:Tfp pilus assembly protein PilW